MVKGDIVRMVDTYWHGDFCEPRDDIGKLFVISGVTGSRYQIRSFEHGGRSSWWNDSQLEFVEHADDSIFEKLDKIESDFKKKQETLSFIKDNFPSVSTISWLKLFDEIGYKSTFLTNGEYFVLYDDVNALYPLFKKIFDNDLNGALCELNNVFKEEFVDRYKETVTKFYNKLKGERIL